MYTMHNMYLKKGFNSILYNDAYLLCDTYIMYIIVILYHILKLIT
jgi:hypothetical protein